MIRQMKYQGTEKLKIKGWERYTEKKTLAILMPEKTIEKEVLLEIKRMTHNDKRTNSTGRHSDLNCECTSNNIASKYIKKNLTELKVKTDQ